jgi:hypothetical protein
VLPTPQNKIKTDTDPDEDLPKQQVKAKKGDRKKGKNNKNVPIN